jgi:DNA-binding transcriptional MerR regulator
MLGIGDFARYAGVSVRMLRHYDQIGLLVPSRVDPASGYRHYEEDLLERAHTLVALKELGFSLEEVGRLLDIGTSGPDATELRLLLAERRADLRRQIDADRERLAEVERRLHLLEGEEVMQFEEKALPELVLTQLSTTVADHDEIGQHVGPMFEELVTKLHAQGIRSTGPAVAWYDEDGDGIEVGVGFPTPPTDVAERVTVPAAERAVVATYRGAMSGIGDAWQELGAHVTREGLSFAGPCREVYLQADGPEETWVTELQQPVA